MVISKTGLGIIQSITCIICWQANEEFEANEGIITISVIDLRKILIMVKIVIGE